jgi:hypothetical protein
MMIALAMVISPIASAHEAKDYTILLKSDGATPSQVPSGVLVTTDRLFFMMVDPGENKSQRILVDTDGDGNFLGTDDISSPWLTSSCSLDEEGNKTDPECAVTFSLEMGPSNGLLPGMVRFQIQHMNETQLASNITFSAFFSEDNHVVPPEIPQPSGEVDTSTNAEDLARIGLAIGGLSVAFFLLVMIRQSRD